MNLLTLEKEQTISTSTKPIRHQSNMKSKEVISQIRTLERQIAANESIFNTITDSDLIEAIIYENLALQSRYRYYLCIAKNDNLTASLVNQVTWK